MKDLKDEIWKDYEASVDLGSNLTIGSEEYKFNEENRDKIRNELIKLEQMEKENVIKKRQIESESKRSLVQNGINITTFLITTCVSVYTIVRTFKFDQDSTVTSTLGRNTLNGIASKIFKR